MYHKPKPVPPTAENVHEYDNNEFLNNVKEKVKEINEMMKRTSENPE
jgi:transcription initiation factor IIE alpha subunit